MTAKATYIWDPLVRLFHWSLVLAFAANALLVDDDSKLHLWIGYFVFGLVVLRIAWGFVGSHYARFASFPPSLRGAMDQVSAITLGRKAQHKGHTPLGALMIYNLLATLVIISLTGFLLTGQSSDGAEWAEELHEAAVAWAEISALLHIIAVMFESLRTGVNLPKAMITGYKNLR